MRKREKKLNKKWAERYGKTLAIHEHICQVSATLLRKDIELNNNLEGASKRESESVGGSTN